MSLFSLSLFRVDVPAGGLFQKLNLQNDKGFFLASHNPLSTKMGPTKWDPPNGPTKWTGSQPRFLDGPNDFLFTTQMVQTQKSAEQGCASNCHVVLDNK